MNYLAEIERTFKTGIRYVSAVNQSRAKWILDPTYEAVAAALIRSTPVSPALLAERYEENMFFSYQKQWRKLQYTVEDWDFSQARPDLLTDQQRALMENYAAGESAFSAAATFLNAFRSSPELASFFGIWMVEELNHHWGYQHYLERMGQGWTAEHRQEVTRPDFRAYAEDAMEVAAANMYQELAAYLIYRSFAKQCRDPFLAKMVGSFAKDELRHYKFYQAVVARHIQKEPDFRKVVLKHFFKATTPVNQLPGGPGKVVELLTRTAFYFRKPEYDYLLKQVEFLVGTSLEPLFTFFFRRHLPPCDACREEIFLCACEAYEADAKTSHEASREVA